MWVLILMLSAGDYRGGVAVTSINFNTEDRCKTAGERAVQNNPYGYNKIGYVCVKQ